MDLGPHILLAIGAAALATLVWWVAAKLKPDWPALALFLFGVALAFVISFGPVKIP